MAVCFPAGVSRAIITTVAGGLCLSLLSLAGHAQGTHKVIDADGFQVDGKPASRNLPIDGTTKLTGRRGDEILLSCAQEKKLFLYVCTEGDCEMSACAEGGKGVTRREWSFKSADAKSADTEWKIPKWLQALVQREPKPLAIAAARGMGGPADAVVLLDDKGVHFAHALAGVLEGRYCLILGTLPASAQTWRTELQWDRSRDPEGLATVPGLAPGLYSLRKGSAGPDCRPDPNEDDGWVLIARSGQFSQIDAEWRLHAASVEEFERSGLSPGLVATLRRVALAGLAEP
jgi:hypothetical protein